MYPKIVRESVVMELETEDDRKVAAIRAPGLARVKLAYTMTEIGTGLLLKTLEEIKADEKSLGYEEAAKILGEYAAQRALLQAQKKEARG